MAGEKLGEYQLRFKADDTLDSFVAREKLSVPVLVQLNGKAPRMGKPTRRFKTMATASGEFRALAEIERLVYRLEKQGTHAFDFITLGRADNNDIVLDHGHVPLAAAYFLHQDGNWTIQNWSGKGVLLNGRELAKEEKADLVDGSNLAIKKFEFAYHSPKGLYAAILEARAKYARKPNSA